ncbi:protoporphyrinogen/coproporphyrinogen oxidase [Parendozoicomonas haliclonae]|uniref:Amine oxidase domain-containing protein n=1 Tax=Parendozoicomonas haliclonae TaxID=1960125 RepID=A0A1X7AS36_9GAMM|nr:FAD-dependent oxidoreductase [Parendozoicomonas haliclonae]SMA50890.1 hypothetical protein EHSB41UT_04708 [Parendozoicomonas haliclonae]
MRNIDVVILGAGVAGLGASLKARQLGHNSIIFEERSSAGGLLDNFEVEGYRFDNAVHLSFAKEQEVRSIFDRTPYYTHPADSRNFEEDRWLKHPVQNNLYPLSVEDKVALVQSFINRSEVLSGDDYESWLRHQYGDAIAERYPLKYTKKYWDTPASRLSTTWIGNRMRRANLTEILYGTYTENTPNTYYTKDMRYPVKGGFKSFIKPLIEQADIRCNHRVTNIDLKKRIVTFNSGESVSYQTLINTIPLPLFVGLCEGVPARVRDAASRLIATSIDLISVGFNRIITKDLWFYIYDEDVYASRAYSPSVKSPDNAPPGCSSLQFEIYSRGRDSKYSVDELKNNVMYALKKMKLAKEEDVEFLHHKHLAWGNVIFDSGLEDNRKIVRDFLRSHAVKSCGRFGEWDYFWSNQSFMSGYSIDLL